jgi:transposase
MIPRELEAKILRLRLAEKWPVHTIASQLHVHHDVVERVLRQAGVPKTFVERPKLIDPYVEFVRETWQKYPKLPSSRLWAMCKARGYRGAKDHFRSSVRAYRPRPVAEPFLRLKTLPGEQAQIDWAHFGTLKIGRAERPVVAFVAVLSWSRAIFLRFYLGQQMENFLRGHEGAFEAWNGVARVLLYDNLKSAVLERVGEAIRFNPLLLDFTAHYKFEPRPVAVARGNEKGRVERAIRYVRSSFYVARRWRDLDDLNRQADEWCAREAMDRPWPDDTTRRVRDAFLEEKETLIALPGTPFPTDERREVVVGKRPYVRFDKNDYSVPHELVRKTLVVSASLDAVRVLDGQAEVARHARSFDKGAVVENPAHIAALVEEKRAATKHRGLDRLSNAAPSTRTLLERLAERGKNLGNATQRLLALLDTYGARALEGAVREVLERDVPHVHGVQQVLERERHARGLPPALPIPFPEDSRARSLQVRPHSLDSYDSLGGRAQDDEDDHDDNDDQRDHALAR